MNATLKDSNLVSIAAAAKQSRVHRRTVERWIQKGMLIAITSEADRRKRLVSLDDVIILSKEGERQSSTRSERPTIDLVGVEHSKTDLPQTSDEARNYMEVIDNALQLVYSQHHRMITQLYSESFQPLTLDQLRSGPLGQDLLRIARLARGQVRESKERVLAAIDSVLQLLFWPAAADDYSVPRSFWDTDLGRMLALAKYRAYKPDELVSIGVAAQELGVLRPTIYRWMDDRTLNYVRDDMSGRTFIVRRDIENLIQIDKTFEKARDRGDPSHMLEPDA